MEENELSEREREILRLVATGASNKEIAHMLVISPNTVKVHLRNIFAKVGVASRTEATLYAIKIGLLPLPGGAAAPVVIEEPAVVPDENPAEAAVVILNEGRRVPPAVLFSLALAVLILLGLGAAWAGGRLAPQPTPPAAAKPAALQRWQILASLPAAVQDAAAAAYENRIYLIGGEGPGGITGQVWRYDPAGESWSARAEKPTPVSQAQAVLLGEKIYIPGGRAPDGQAVNVLDIYDPRQDRWEQGAPLPAALYGYALAALEGRLYLFGGWDGSRALATVYRYDPAQDQWQARSDLPAARAYAAAAVTGGKILLAGGWDGRAVLSAVDWYYPARDGSGDAPWESRPALPQPRWRMAAASMADLVYLVGGAERVDSSGSLPPLQYLPQSGVWASFEASRQPAGVGPVLVPLQNTLHVLGGREEGAPLAAHQSYQAIYNIAFPVIQ